MSGQFSNESMLDIYIFETTQLLEQLEQNILDSEKASSYSESTVNEIFRIMHTIKGSSAMMMLENISSLAHTIEDLFYFIREEKPEDIDFSKLSDIVLESVDFIKVEVEKIKNGDNADGIALNQIEAIKEFLSELKKGNITSVDRKEQVIEKQQYYIAPNKSEIIGSGNYFKAELRFEEDCKMENIRAFSVIHRLKDIASELSYIPDDIIDNEESCEVIKNEGFTIFVRTDCSYEKIKEILSETVFLNDLKISVLQKEEEEISESKSGQNASINADKVYSQAKNDQTQKESENKDIQAGSKQQSIISVGVSKLDKLLNLVGEMVIAEAMVIQNPDLNGLPLVNFQKAARQLNKITDEIQDTVMSIRMVPVATTFFKMQRIVRDMSKKLHKEINLELIGEETEVDKNIIEHISDPLMHLIRNAIDHGIEAPEERMASEKPQAGKVILEARNAGSDVVILVKDDGKGLNKSKIYQKAKGNGLISLNENELSEKEIFNFILLPGFSTKDSVSEFSGRGVGMDVVKKNIEAVGGSVSIDSVEGQGTTVILKIPLTLAIIDGINVRVGGSCYTIPTVSIKESFRPKEDDIICDPDGNEMIMVRGQCLSIIRLHELFEVDTYPRKFSEGILVMVESNGRESCIFADEMLGQQQVVVKALPNYIRNSKAIKGLSGCTLMGDGSISLILDINGLNSGLRQRS